MKKKFNTIIKKVGNDNHVRNRKYRTEENKNHPIVKLIINKKIKPKKILEIGCSTGYVLETIRNLTKAKCYGIDVSEKAVNEGKKIFKKINLKVGHFEDQKKVGNFDLIICGFFLFLLPPEKILGLFSKIDQALKYNGYIIIFDFFNKKFKKKNYKHNNDIKVYRWDYKKIMMSLPYYNLIYKNKIFNKKMRDFCEVSLIKKNKI